MEKVMAQSVDQMLAIQVKQNPAMGQFEGQMRAFLGKYMSWASVKEDMIKIYMTEFTEPEIRELIAFYQTPVGKKTVQKLPALLQKSAELSQQRMQQHLPELQQAIQSAAAGKEKSLTSRGQGGRTPAVHQGQYARLLRAVV
jgi:hypothetical protein